MLRMRRPTTEERYERLARWAATHLENGLVVTVTDPKGRAFDLTPTMAAQCRSRGVSPVFVRDGRLLCVVGRRQGIIPEGSLLSAYPPRKERRR